MKDMKALSLSAGAFLALCGAAEALCTKPDGCGATEVVCTKPTGVYVGSSAGAYYSNGYLSNHSSILYYFNFHADGSGLWEQVSKSSAGPLPYNKGTATKNWSAINHAFDNTKCRGFITDGGGLMWAYVSYSGGSSLDVMIYNNANDVGELIMHLKRP